MRANYFVRVRALPGHSLVELNCPVFVSLRDRAGEEVGVRQVNAGAAVADAVLEMIARQSHEFHGYLPDLSGGPRSAEEHCFWVVTRFIPEPFDLHDAMGG